MSLIQVKGLATQTTREFPYGSKELDANLLTWLSEKGVTIASSCSGKGVCKKCIIQNDWPTCQLTLADFIELCPEKKILVDYL